MFFSILLAISVFIMLFGMFFYSPLVKILPKKIPETLKTIPSITILIPAYNEEKFIETKIKNTLQINYPQEKIEIIVIDNGSTDNTTQLVSKFPVTLLLCDERGKVNALNKGISYSKTDIIIITDADVEVSRESIKSMISYLHGDVGAVNGYVISKVSSECKESAFLKQKQNYKAKDWIMRSEESELDSVCSLDGKLIAFRKSIFPRFPKDTLTDDYRMTLDLRKKGYRLFVDKSAKVYEPLNGGTVQEIKQFKRYAKDALITNFKNVNFLFNPKYGYYGLLIFPFRRFFPLFYPIFMIYIIIIVYFIVGIYWWLFLTGVSVILLVYFKKLLIIQLISVILAYFELLIPNQLKGGKWETIRK